MNSFIWCASQNSPQPLILKTILFLFFCHLSAHLSNVHLKNRCPHKNCYFVCLFIPWISKVVPIVSNNTHIQLCSHAMKVKQDKDDIGSLRWHSDKNKRKRTRPSCTWWRAKQSTKKMSRLDSKTLWIHCVSHLKGQLVSRGGNKHIG